MSACRRCAKSRRRPCRPRRTPGDGRCRVRSGWADRKRSTVLSGLLRGSDGRADSIRAQSSVRHRCGRSRVGPGAPQGFIRSPPPSLSFPSSLRRRIRFSHRVNRPRPPANPPSREICAWHNRRKFLLAPQSRSWPSVEGRPFCSSPRARQLHICEQLFGQASRVRTAAAHPRSDETNPKQTPSLETEVFGQRLSSGFDRKRQTGASSLLAFYAATVAGERRTGPTSICLHAHHAVGADVAKWAMTYFRNSATTSLIGNLRFTLRTTRLRFSARLAIAPWICLRKAQTVPLPRSLPMPDSSQGQSRNCAMRR